MKYPLLAAPAVDSGDLVLIIPAGVIIAAISLALYWLKWKDRNK